MLTAKRVKTILPRDGTKAAFFSYSSKWSDGAEDSMPPSELVFVVPLIAWEVSIECGRDEHGIYTEETVLSGIVLCNQYEEPGVIGDDEFFLKYILYDDIEDWIELGELARTAIKEKRQRELRRTEARQLLQTLRILMPVHYSNHGIKNIWKCVVHGFAFELQIGRSGLETWGSGCACSIPNQINHWIAENAKP